jgi:hypothetical protein
MNDKVNVEIIVPEIEEKYNILLPVNKKIGTIIILLNKAINDLSFGEFNISRCNKLYNADSLNLYKPESLLFETDIRNGTRLILFSK